MYWLPQAGRIAHDSLVQHLAPYGFHTSINTPRICTHNIFPINFNLVVDYFGVNYSVKEHALHLKSALEDKYKVTTDCKEKRYIGISLQWDYKKSRSSYPCQDMYMQPSIHFNNRNQNDHNIHQNYGPRQSMERITRFWTRKNQLNNWMSVIKNYSKNYWNITVLC